MTLRIDEKAAAVASLSAETVADYLRAHPDFFKTHVDVLRDIEIDHASGDAASLLERQVLTLRADNRRMKTRFDELVALATSNQDLIKRIHQLALALMDAAGPEAIFNTLKDRLAREFKADHACTLIFGNPSFVEAIQAPQFVGKDWPEQELFAETLAGKMPQCGPLSAAQTSSLMEYAIPASGSAVVLPLSGASWSGLQIIFSNDTGRFRADMGTDFLTYLGDIVSLIVDPWVAKSDKI